MSSGPQSCTIHLAHGKDEEEFWLFIMAFFASDLSPKSRILGMAFLDWMDGLSGKRRLLCNGLMACHLGSMHPEL
jgi:hypothetical protein